jgi:hypothetical protein
MIDMSKIGKNSNILLNNNWRGGGRKIIEKVFYGIQNAIDHYFVYSVYCNFQTLLLFIFLPPPL